MLKIWNIAAVILAMLAVQAGAQNLPAEVANVREALSGFHDVPGADYWQRFNPEQARAALTQLSSDKNEMIHIRTRATLALVNFPDAQVEQHLKATFEGQERGYVRAAALKAYSSIAGQSAAPALEAALEDKDDLVKISAIRTLGDIGGAVATAMLEKGMEREIDPVARSAFKRSLQRASRR